MGFKWHCKKATQPVNETSSISYPKKNIIVDVIKADIMKKMKPLVTFFNITNLSKYKIDGHPFLFMEED
jgi:hypothetical protein